MGGQVKEHPGMFGMSKLCKRPKNRRYVVVMAVGGEDKQTNKQIKLCKNRRYVVVMAVGGEDKQLAGRIDGGERSNSQATLNRSCCQRLDLVGDK